MCVKVFNPTTALNHISELSKCSLLHKTTWTFLVQYVALKQRVIERKHF